MESRDRSPRAPSRERDRAARRLRPRRPRASMQWGYRARHRGDRRFSGLSECPTRDASKSSFPWRGLPQSVARRSHDGRPRCCSLDVLGSAVSSPHVRVSRITVPSSHSIASGARCGASRGRYVGGAFELSRPVGRRQPAHRSDLERPRRATRAAGPQALVPPGIPFDALPPLDAILLSHNHYDHLDDRTVRRLIRRYPEAAWFAPSGVASFVRAAPRGSPTWIGGTKFRLARCG